MVFDPSIFDRPVPLDEWIAIQTKHKKGKVNREYFTQRFNYFPKEKRPPNMSFYSEEDIDHAESTMSMYLQIQNLRKARGKNEK
jgi:hypothetical protein